MYLFEFEIPFPVHVPPASTALRFTIGPDSHRSSTLKIVALAGSISVTVILSEDVQS